MADLELNPGYTVQGTPIQSLTELTTAADSAIQHIQQSGVDYRIQTQNFLKTYLAYGQIYTSAATAQAHTNTYATLDFATSGVNGESLGITSDEANNKLILNTAGTYQISYQIPFVYHQAAGITTLFISQLNIGGSAINASGDVSYQTLPCELYTNTLRSECAMVHLGDIAASSPDLEFPIWGGMPPVFIRDVSLLIKSVDTPSTSGNYFTPTVTNVTPSPDEALGSRATWNTTPSPDVADDPVAYTTWDIGCSTNQLLGADEVLKLAFVETGTAPSTYSDVTAVIRYSNSCLADGFQTPFGLLNHTYTHICTSPPEDVTVKIRSVTNATTWIHDLGTKLTAVRLS